MAETFEAYLVETLDAVRGDTGGEVFRVPEALATADPDSLAVAICSTDGVLSVAGDADRKFTIQSVSKAFVYALALQEHGIDGVLERVDVEPSGEAYNVISVEPESNRPRNPMINAGALTIHAMVRGARADSEERVEFILERLSAMAGRQLSIDEGAASDELAQADRNRAIAYMLRAEGVMPDDAEVVVRGYTRQCSILVSVRDLAMMAATLANGGRQPATGEEILPLPVTRQALSVMTTCGMYDSAGDWMSDVGIPAKSGVAGSIMGAMPGRGGMAAYSPRLDRHGTSVRGEQVFERLSQELGMHLLDDPRRGDDRWNALQD
ncbi:MAG TPA: glutaminase A [Ornithinicoccus sp.]|nr:glutaminase A [Ornithinicoccus sp.]